MHIYYLYCRRNQNPIRHYVAATGCSHLSKITPLSYESAFRRRKFPAGMYIFSDIELLHGEDKQQAVDLHAQLQSQGNDYRILNNPTQSLSRYPLLRKLYDEGLNEFNVHCASDDLSSVSFPVFLRRTDDHRGPQSELLRDRQALRSEIEKLAHCDHDLKDWLVTEFCNVSNAQGWYRKYSAFCVDKHIIARHLFFGTEWIQKYSSKGLPEEFLQEERDFLKHNAYVEQLQKIFEIANIQYGRIDFGVLNGRVQTWEINTNPMICARGQLLKDSRKDIHTVFVDEFHKAIDHIAYLTPQTKAAPHLIPSRLGFRLLAFGEAHLDSKIGQLCQRAYWKWQRITGRSK